MIRHLFLSAALISILPAQSLDQIVKLHARAVGGEEAFSKIDTLRLTAKLTAGAGMEIPMTIEVKKPGRIRMDMSVMGKAMVQVIDGKNSWMINPMMGSEDPTPMPPEMIEQLEGQSTRFKSPLLGYKEAGSTLELLGKEKAEGGEAYKLKLVDKHQQESVLFLDADTYLISKMTRKVKAMGQELNATIKFGDYKAISGMMFGHSLDIAVENMPMASQRLVMEKIEVNAPVDESRFVMPKKAAPKPVEAPAPAAKP